MNYETQRWIALVSSIIVSLCAGFCYAWSVFQKPLINIFHWSPADVAVSFSLLMSVAATMAIAAGKALDYMQPRQVTLIGGTLLGIGIAGIGFIQTLYQLYTSIVIAGIGIGFIYPGGTISNILRFFPDKQGLASGLLAGGFGLGALVWAPVSVMLIAQYGVFSALKMLGVFFFCLIALISRVMVTAPNGYIPNGWTPPKQAEGTKSTDKNWKQMLTDPMFYFIGIVFTLGCITGMMVVGQASPIAQDLLKLTPQAAAGIVGLMSIGMCGGKVLWGAVSDKIGRNLVIVLTFVMGGSAVAVLPMTSTYYSLAGAIMVIASCYGGILAVMAPITAELFGTKNLGLNFGIMFLTVALAAAIGPRLVAVIKQTTGEYTMAFQICVVINLAGLVLLGAYVWYKKRKNPLRQIAA